MAKLLRDASNRFMVLLGKEDLPCDPHQLRLLNQIIVPAGRGSLASILRGKPFFAKMLPLRGVSRHGTVLEREAVLKIHYAPVLNGELIDNWLNHCDTKIWVSAEAAKSNSGPKKGP